MTSPENVRPIAAHAPATAVEPVPEAASPLLFPTAEGDGSLDALSHMLAMLAEQNSTSLRLNLEEIKTAREQLEDLQRQLAEQLRRALAAAQKSQKKDKGGWFSRTFGKLVDEVAKVFAKHVEVVKDIVVLPADMTVSFAKNLGNREALLQSLRNDLNELSKSSDTEQAVAGFISGTTKFMTDVMAFEAVLLAALAENAVRGEPLADAVKERGVALWESLKTNILENPEFWKVTERLVQALAVAAAIVSGGTLGIVAVALIVLLEADNRYGFIESAVGEKAAPWVRLGISLVAAACSAVGSAGISGALAWVQAAAGVIQGVGGVYQGVRTMQEADRKADEHDRQSDVQETLYRMQEIQRIIDALIELYEEKSEHRTQTTEAGVKLVQTQGDTQAALIFQG